MYYLTNSLYFTSSHVDFRYISYLVCYIRITVEQTSEAFAQDQIHGESKLKNQGIRELNSTFQSKWTSSYQLMNNNNNDDQTPFTTFSTPLVSSLHEERKEETK